LNERGEYLKAATLPPGIIRDSVLKNLKRRSESTQTLSTGVRAKMDFSVAQIEKEETIQRDQPQSSQMEAKSEEIRGRLMKLCTAWAAIGAEKQIIMDIMPLWASKHSKQILQTVSHPTQPRGNLHQYYLLLQEEIFQNIVIQVNPLFVKQFFPTFCIPKRDGSFRKIQDARKLNKQTKKIHFKMISPFDVQHALLKNFYLTSIDIKSAFNHITVHPSLQPYLGFQVEDRSYVYIEMPFELRLAPIIFTKTLHIALAAIKKDLYSTILLYSVDILIINEHPESSTQESQLIMNKVLIFGWIINEKKSELQPINEIRYLGWIWNMEEMIVKMPLDRQIKLILLNTSPYPTDQESTICLNQNVIQTNREITISQIPIPTGIFSSNQIESFERQS
ncbi:MAG: putative reverse transcriptase, partial [Streblomastix strix]